MGGFAVVFGGPGLPQRDPVRFSVHRGIPIAEHYASPNDFRMTLPDGTVGVYANGSEATKAIDRAYFSMPVLVFPRGVIDTPNVMPVSPEWVVNPEINSRLQKGSGADAPDEQQFEWLPLAGEVRTKMLAARDRAVPMYLNLCTGAISE